MSLAYSNSGTYFFTTFFQDKSTNTNLYFKTGITGFDTYTTDNFSFVKSEFYSAVYQDYVILECDICSLVEEYQCIGPSCTMKMEAYSSSKSWCLSTKLHGVKSQRLQSKYNFTYHI